MMLFTFTVGYTLNIELTMVDGSLDGSSLSLRFRIGSDELLSNFGVFGSIFCTNKYYNKINSCSLIF